MSMDVWNGIAYCGLGFGARTLFVTDFATGTILFSYETNSVRLLPTFHKKFC